MSSLYSEHSTINDLVDNLMIEQWNSSVIYKKYYNECRPIQWIYTFETRNDVIYIVTTLFGIAGGLTTVLEFVVLRSVKFIMHCIQKQRARVIPETSFVQGKSLPFEKYFRIKSKVILSTFTSSMIFLNFSHLYLVECSSSFDFDKSDEDDILSLLKFSYSN